MQHRTSQEALGAPPRRVVGALPLVRRSRSLRECTVLRVALAGRGTAARCARVLNTCYRPVALAVLGTGTGAAAHSAGCWLLAVAATAGIQEAPARGCRTCLSQALSVGRAYTSTLYASAVCEVPPHTAITGLATNAAWAVATSN